MTLLLALVLLNTSWLAVTALAIFLAVPFALDVLRHAAAAARQAVAGKPLRRDVESVLWRVSPGPEAASSNAALRAGITLLRHYLDRYHGDRALVLAAYYQGQTAADRHGVYRVTRPYIASISALEKFFAS